MGKLFKDSYASTYAARNVKEALDKLIDVLQSPAHVHKLVMNTCHEPPAGRSRPTGPRGKLKFEPPAPPVAKKQHAQRDAQVVPPPSANPNKTVDAQVTSSGTSTATESKKTTDSQVPVPVPVSGNPPVVVVVEGKKSTSSNGSRASETPDSGDGNSDHIPVGRFTQVTNVTNHNCVTLAVFCVQLCHLMLNHWDAFELNSA